MTFFPSLAKLPRISDIEIVEKNAERIVITWKPPYATEFSIHVVISCLNCQKDEAVYVPGNILSGNRWVLVFYDKITSIINILKAFSNHCRFICYVEAFDILFTKLRFSWVYYTFCILRISDKFITVYWVRGALLGITNIDQIFHVNRDFNVPIRPINHGNERWFFTFLKKLWVSLEKCKQHLIREGNYNPWASLIRQLYSNNFIITRK